MSLKRVAAADESSSAAGSAVALPGWKRPFLALESPDFRHLWFGTLPGTLAMQMSMIARGYVAYDITESAAAVGFVAMAQGVPMLIFSLFGGVVADRFPKRDVLLVTNVVQVLYAATTALLVLTGAIQIWHLMILAAVSGLGIAFSMPARHSYVAQIVPRERLVHAVSLNMAGINFTRIAGPAVAGGLMTIAWIGPGGVFLLMTFMYAYVFARLLSITDRGDPVGDSGVPALRSIAMGLSYVRGNGVVFTLLMLAFVPVLLGMPYQHLMPVFSEGVFDVGPGGLGLMMAANGVGALLGALTIASMAGFERRGMLQLALGIVFGMSLAAFAFSPSFAMAVALLVVVGVASAGYQSLNNTLLLDNAEANYRGRVMSIYMFTHAATPLAVVPIGLLSDAYGAPLVVGIAGLLLLAIISLVGFVHPTYRHVR